MARPEPRLPAGRRHGRIRASALALALAASGLSFADAGSTGALVDAIEHRGFDAARLSIESGADANARLSHGKTPIMLAAKLGDADTVRMLVDAGADVNARTDNGGTPLMFAAISGHEEPVGILIGAGADVNAVAHFDWTPMMVAAAKGHATVIRLLAAHGADPNHPDVYGWTPIMRAANGGKRRAVAALLESPGVDLAAREERGATVLHIAAEQGFGEIVAMLLRAGADREIRDRFGRDAAAVATAAGHPGVAERIERAGD